MEVTNGVSARLNTLERQVDRLLDLEPGVVKAQVANLKEDVHEIKEDVAAIRKILIGFLITFAFTGISTVIAVIAVIQPK